MGNHNSYSDDFVLRIFVLFAWRTLRLCASLLLSVHGGRWIGSGIFSAPQRLKEFAYRQNGNALDLSRPRFQAHA
jgi:hypothetical protein